MTHNGYIVSLVLIALMSLGMAQMAHATNESSYQYGHKLGKIQDKICELNVKALESDCSRTAADLCSGQVTNNTACIDGFVKGWNSVCDEGDQDINCPDNATQEFTPTSS